jgi:flagellar assembly protein FliH
MLSRVLSPAALEVRTIKWETRVSAAKPKPPNGTAPASQAAQLEARIAELTAAAAAQSRQAYDEGLRAGETAGRRSAEAQLAEAVRQLTSSVAAVADTRENVLRRAEADLVGLAVGIARRGLPPGGTVDSSALRALTGAAIEKLQGQEIYRVRVHPGLEAMVRSSLEEAGRGRDVEVVKDPAQPEGGVVFETARGYLDASVNTQLDEIERGLADQLRERS